MKKNTLQSLYGVHYKRVGNQPPTFSVNHLLLKEYSVKPWLPNDRACAVLDVGCGYGRELYILSKLGFTDLTGIEMTKESFEIAKKELKDRAHIVYGDAFRIISRVKEKYDLIILFDVLEHIETERVVQYLTYLYNALKKGGTLVVRVPNMGNILAAYSRYIDFTHKNGFTEFSLMQILDAVGFVEHKIVHQSRVSHLSRWTIVQPWRNLRIKQAINIVIHKFLFAIRSQEPTPTVFDMNIEMYTKK